jgi:antitoxin StbD
MKSAQGSAVAVLNRNRVMGYLISAQVFEAMIERLADVERADLVTVRGQDL